MKIFNLREYQEEAEDEIRYLFKSGYNKVILCQPTGSGKTVTFADIARKSVANGFKVMIIVDRKELLQQARNKLISYGLTPSLITAGKTGNSNSKCFIATVQTLTRRELPKVDLIIVDEAHKQIFDKILAREEYKNCFVIGATATPVRKGKMNQLSDYYQKMVETVTIKDLIKKGFLVPAITFGAKVDTSNIKMKGRDFDTESMYQNFNKSTLYSGVVDKYEKLAKGTKAICFNINVKHSLKVTQSFIDRGYRAVHLDGKTKAKEREMILEGFSKGHYDVLCNVDVLTTGYDEWTIETVIVNRATKSLPLWLQMAGRGSRITPAEFVGNSSYLQKSHFNLLDMGGNVFELGFWEQDRKFSLIHRKSDKENVAPVKTCPENEQDENKKTGCGAILNASAKECRYCGYKFPKKEKKEVESDFIQLINQNSLPPELAEKNFSQMTFEELEKVKQIKGYKFGWVIRQIMMSPNMDLLKYAQYKKYKYPQAWVKKMEKMYLKK